MLSSGRLVTIWTRPSIKWAGASLGARVRTFVKVFSADASRAARSSTCHELAAWKSTVALP
jgi:hypothetical protein